MKAILNTAIGLCLLIIIAAVVGLNWYGTRTVMHHRCVSTLWGIGILAGVLCWARGDLEE